MRNFLKKQLPEYMMPSVFVPLKHLPVNPNGKIDRKALPAPEPIRGRAEIEPPQTPVEEALARIWREVIGVENVGREDNFFDVGGHSLAMARVQEKLRKEFRKDIPLVAMFEHATIRALARYLAGDLPEAQFAEQIGLRTGKQSEHRRRRMNRGAALDAVSQLSPRC